MKTNIAALAYRESSALGASGTEIVVLLYDRLAQDLQSAIDAISARNVESRSAHVSHALLVLQQLQGTLDFTAGGAAARQLDSFYHHVRGKLLEAQIKQSSALMLEQRDAIAQVRECWATVGRSTTEQHGGGSANPAAIPNDEPERAPQSWGA